MNLKKAISKVLGLATDDVASESRRIERKADHLIASDTEYLNNGGTIMAYPAVIVAAAVRAATYATSATDGAEESANTVPAVSDEDLSVEMSVDDLIQARQDAI